MTEMEHLKEAPLKDVIRAVMVAKAAGDTLAENMATAEIGCRMADLGDLADTLEKAGEVWAAGKICDVLDGSGSGAGRAMIEQAAQQLGVKLAQTRDRLIAEGANVHGTPGYRTPGNQTERDNKYLRFLGY